MKKSGRAIMGLQHKPWLATLNDSRLKEQSRRQAAAAAAGYCAMCEQPSSITLCAGCTAYLELEG